MAVRSISAPLAAGSPGRVNPSRWSSAAPDFIFSNYGDDHLLQFGSLPASDQIGMGLHLAALAALAGDAQLATRLRHRTANEAARNREQASRRARIQTGCLVAQCRFLLADTSRNRLQLSEAWRCCWRRSGCKSPELGLRCHSREI